MRGSAASTVQLTPKDKEKLILRHIYFGTSILFSKSHQF